MTPSRGAAPAPRQPFFVKKGWTPKNFMGFACSTGVVRADFFGVRVGSFFARRFSRREKMESIPSSISRGCGKVGKAGETAGRHRMWLHRGCAFRFGFPHRIYGRGGFPQGENAQVEKVCGTCGKERPGQKRSLMLALMSRMTSRSSVLERTRFSILSTECMTVVWCWP